MTHGPWRQLFGEVERVYGQLAGVLREADGLLDQAGYARPEGENSVESQISGSIGKPSWWFPGWLARFYVPVAKGAPPQLIYVAVYLHNRAGDDMRPLDEPVIAGGIWRFDTPARKSYPSWLAKGWAWGAKVASDGTLVDRVLHGHGLDARGRCFGVALASVIDPESLKAQVVDPLVTLARGQW